MSVGLNREDQQRAPSHLQLTESHFGTKIVKLYFFNIRSVAVTVDMGFLWSLLTSKFGMLIPKSSKQHFHHLNSITYTTTLLILIVRFTVNP